MKTKLLFTKQRSNSLFALLVFCLCFNYGWSQELVLNGTADMFSVTSSDASGNGWTRNDSDNADAWDMTPNSTVILDVDAMAGPSAPTSPSPFVFWKNDALEDALEQKYLGMAGSLDEQPGSTSSGNNGTRGVKLYDDGSPNIGANSSRRLYQLVQGLTIGNDYNFSIDSRSEAAGTPSEVYILNTAIANEDGIDANKYADASVVTGMDITNDEDAWVTNTFTFTATTTEVVIYVRSLNSIDGNTEVFYDNISLQMAATASVDDVFASNLKIYPNPANDYLTIESKNIKIESIEIYSLLGQKMKSDLQLKSNRLDVSDLSNGLYLLKVNSESGSSTRKIVIE